MRKILFILSIIGIVWGIAYAARMETETVSSGGISAFDNLTINTNSSAALQIKGGTGANGQMLITNATGLAWANTSAGGGGGGLSITGTAPNASIYVSSGNTLAGAPLIVNDGSNLTVGIGTTGNSARLYIRGASSGTTGFALRIADSVPVDRLVVLDNGNVGIGTTSPAAPLDVGGIVRTFTTTPTGASATTDNGIVFNAGNSLYSGIFTEVSGKILSYSINASQVGTRNASFSGGIFRLDAQGNGLFSVYGYNTAGANKSLFEIPLSGTVPLKYQQPRATGYGLHTVAAFYATDAPAANVGGGLSFGGAYTGAGGINSGTEFASIGGVKENGTDGNYDGALIFGTRTVASGHKEQMRITSTGNVGIGITATIAKLDLRNTSTAPTDTLYIRTAGTTSNFALRIADSLAADKLVVLDNGNVGIGSTNPTANLTIIPANTASLLTLRVSNTAGGDALSIMAGNGNVGIGTTAPTAKLQVNQVLITGTTKTGFALCLTSTGTLGNCTTITGADGSCSCSAF